MAEWYEDLDTRKDGGAGDPFTFATDADWENGEEVAASDFDLEAFLPGASYVSDDEWDAASDDFLTTAGKVGSNIASKWEQAGGGLIESAGSSWERIQGSIDQLNRNKPEDESYFHYVGKNMAAMGDLAIAGIQQGAKDLAQILSGEKDQSELNDTLKTVGSDIRKAAAADLQKNGYDLEMDQPLFWVANFADALAGDLGPTVATATLAGPAAGLSLMGAKVYGMTYADEIAKGKSPVEAGQAAAFKSLAEALSERIPLGEIMKTGGAGLKAALKKAGISWLDEGGQEVLVGFINQAYDSGIVPKDADLKSFMEAMTSDARLIEAFQEFMIGGMAGSGASLMYDAATQKSQRQNDALKKLREQLAAQQREAELQAGQDQMAAATSAEQVVAAAETIVAAPLDTFELDQFHQTLTEQGLSRQAQIDAIPMSEGPFPNTKLWRETYPSGGGFLAQASDAEVEAFESYDGLSEEAKAVTPEPVGFQDWKAATAQVADQEVANSIADEETAVKTLSYLEQEVGAILDNEEVGPEVRNTQIRDALERAKTQAQPTQNDNPDDTDGGDGGGGAAAVKTAESPKEVTVYGSGANGKADFAAQQKAGVRSGVEANRLSAPMIEEVARSDTPVFVDSGAFGAFRNGETVDFGKVYDTYEAIDAKSEQPNMRFVTPDVIGDQQATLTLQAEFADRTNALIDKGHEALVPIQKGKMKPRQVVEQVRKTLGHDNFTVAIPSNEAAFTENDLRDLMRARPKRVHFLGVASNTQKLGKLTKIVRAFVPDAEISSDGNQIRAVTDKKFAQEAKTRKDDKAGDKIQTEPKYDETEEIQSFIANPEAVPKAQLQAFLDAMPFKMTAEQAVKNPEKLAAKVEEFDPNWDAARLAYNKAVKPQAVREVAGEVRTEMVAEKLSAKQQKAKDAGQMPLFKRAGKPLSKIRVTTQATVAETGETVEIEQRADVALSEIDNRIGALQQLLGCVA